ncbi:H-NS histone family protein [Terasakiella pusilla]|uniref:H-NS histone family protein n=1 Tax=Terasakiella pusilla TaxID=64973 RepID=UPI000491586B|nr:H-NS histone family protein [Terasakiella pusilla]
MLHKNQLIKKTNIVYTPLHLSRWLTDLVLSVHKPSYILDPCSGEGNLTKFFDGVKVKEFEIQNGTNFFNQHKKLPKVDLVLMNPPYVSGDRTTFMPEKFLRHVLDIVPEGTPIVAVMPFNFRLNCRKNSQRLRFLNELNITSVITLPFNIFQDTLYSTEIICLNLPQLKSHYTYIPPDSELVTNRRKQMSSFKLIEKHKLKKMNVADLEALVSEISEYIEYKKKDEAVNTRQEVQDMLSAKGLTFEEVFGVESPKVKTKPKSKPRSGMTATPKAKKKATPVKKKADGRGAAPVAPKYMNPANPEETWSKGGIPTWVKGIMEEKGITIEEFKASPDYLNPTHPNYEEFKNKLSNT